MHLITLVIFCIYGRKCTFFFLWASFLANQLVSCFTKKNFWFCTSASRSLEVYEVQFLCNMSWLTKFRSGLTVTSKVPGLFSFKFLNGPDLLAAYASSNGFFSFFFFFARLAASFIINKSCFLDTVSVLCGLNYSFQMAIFTTCLLSQLWHQRSAMEVHLLSSHGSLGEIKYLIRSFCAFY